LTGRFRRTRERPAALLILILGKRSALVYNAVPGGPARLAILGLRTAIADGIDTVLFHDGGDELGITLMAALFAGLGMLDFRDTDPLASETLAPDEEWDRLVAVPKQEVVAELVLLARSPTKIPAAPLGTGPARRLARAEVQEGLARGRFG
jgi:hypothetical protein